jgi:hypothetical protein
MLMARGLESASAKIVRAMKLRQPLQDCITEYGDNQPYTKNVKPDGKVILQITKAPPIEISVMAGEIIYQLRSALDHMFFDLVERNWNGRVPEKIANRLYFPLCVKPPGEPTKQPPIPRSSFGEAVIPGCLPDEAFEVIESLQPYYHLHYGHQLLRMLNVFGRIDRHRHLNATAVAVNRSHTVMVRPSGFSSTVMMPWLKHGAELQEPWHDLKIDESMETTDEYEIVLGFDEPEYGPVQIAPMADVYALPTFIFNISVHLKKFLV